MFRRIASASALIVALSPAAARSGYAVAPISVNNYNLIVSNNLASGSEVDGATLVGGTVSGGQSQYAGHSGLPNTSGSLVVGGGITSSGITMNGGALVVGGSINPGTTVNLNGGSAGYTGQLGQAGFPTNLAFNVNSYLNALSASYLTGAYKEYSSALAPSANTVALIGNNLNFNVGAVDSRGVAYLDVTASTLNTLLAGAGQLNLNLNNGLAFTPGVFDGHGISTVVIDVTGPGAVSFSGGNMVGNFSQANAPSILWNFTGSIDGTGNYVSNATTSVDVSRQFDGAILAPSATLTNSTSIQGSVFVQNFTQNGEVHLGGSNENTNFSGYIPVPEPASLALLGLGAPALLALARSRRRRPG